VVLAKGRVVLCYVKLQFQLGNDEVLKAEEIDLLDRRRL